MKQTLESKRKTLTSLYKMVNADIESRKNKSVIITKNKQGERVWRLRPIDANPDLNESLFSKFRQHSIVEIIKFVNQRTNFIKAFELSQQGIKQIFAILGSFYNAMIQEEVTELNPVVQIRQKSKFIRKQASGPTIRRLSDQQWQTVLATTKQLAEQNPTKHKRTLFMLQMLYSMYLRISELASTPRWGPKMSDFFRDINNDWWFKTVGKGNKMRQIAVSAEMLEALRQYREYLGCSPLPSPDDQNPLIQKDKGKGAMKSTRVIRQLIQICFDAAVEQLRSQNEYEEAEMLRSVTVHWLRHTGISDDVKHRPREHVRDDAGHSSSAITDRYVNVELKERAKTARHKTWGEKV